MRHYTFLLLLSLSLTDLARGEVAATFYVAPAPRGDDQNAGSRAAPFATLDRARLAVREYRKSQDTSGETVVEIESGRYELAAPVRFSAEDSGEPGGPVVYRAASVGSVVLSGGRGVKDWKREGDGGVFAADVGRGVDFRQLWVGSRRAVRAREPNAGAYLTMVGDKQADGFDLPRETLRTVTLRRDEVEIAVTIAWMHKRLRIARLAAGATPDTVRAIVAEPEWDAVTTQPQGDRVYTGRTYWLENAPEFLDAPGEYYLDTSSGVLRYRARLGEEPNNVQVIRPELENLIVLAGTPDAPVHDLRFEGIVFSHTGWTRPNRFGFVDVQANSLIPADPAAAVDPQYRHDQCKDRIPAAFQASTADRIVLRGCRFFQLGGTGVTFTGGGDDNVVEGNSFYDLAAGGVEIGEDAARPKNERLFPRRNRISDNFIAHIGEDYWGSVAILGYYTEASEITRNEIAAIPYTAISQGWGWGNPAAPAASRDNRITHNRVHNYMRRLDDGGGIYTTDRLLRTEIAGNVLQHMLTPDVQTKAGGALYLDQFTEGVRVHHTVVREAIRWLFIWNANIRGNVVEANYADTSAQRNDGTDNRVEAVFVLGGGTEPAAVRAIDAGAGLSKTWSAAREYGPGADVVIESSSLDVHREGAWEITQVKGSYGGTVGRARSGEARARVWPVLPKAGLYEVSVWRTGARGIFEVRHTEGVSRVVVDERKASELRSADGWVTLGRFRFSAGIGGQVTVSPGEKFPNADLVLDAFRWRQVGE